jgi:hypothetical protein
MRGTQKYFILISKIFPIFLVLNISASLSGKGSASFLASSRQIHCHIPIVQDPE